MSPLEERLRRPEDAAAIRTLDATHGRQLDDGDWPALVALFTEDGVSDGLSRVQRHHRPGATHPGAVNAALRDHVGD